MIALTDQERIARLEQALNQLCVVIMSNATLPEAQMQQVSEILTNTNPVEIPAYLRQRKPPEKAEGS